MSKYKTITARQIYKDDKICIRKRIIIDQDENIVDSYISARKVVNGKVLSGKTGIVQIENLADPKGVHTDKLTNLFLSYNYGYLARKVCKDENGIYTLGTPIKFDDTDPILSKNSNGLPHENAGDEQLTYANEISAFHGCIGHAIKLLSTSTVIKLARNAYFDEFDKAPDSFFPTNLCCLDKIQQEYKSALRIEEKLNKRRSGKVAETICNKNIAKNQKSNADYTK